MGICSPRLLAKQTHAAAAAAAPALPLPPAEAAPAQPLQEDPAAAARLDIDKEVTKFARSAATTFAPRASTATQNPAYKGSLLYTVFEVQAWAALAVGGLLSFNLIFPSDHPDVARMLG